MARVLIGWELGSNQGHIRPLAKIAADLISCGHLVAIALQDMRWVGLLPKGLDALENAPRWPGLDRPLAVPQNLAGLGDALVAQGLGEEGVFETILAKWDDIFRRTKPDLVIADFAPGLLCFARNRVRSLAVGTGFTCPPTRIPAFVRFVDCPAYFDVNRVFDLVNRQLANRCQYQIAALPEIFHSDDVALQTYPELDPYRGLRSSEKYFLPNTHRSKSRGVASQKELFVYSYNEIPAESHMWDAIWGPAIPVRIYMADPTPEHIDRFRTLGFTVEPVPLSFARIAQRSRLILSHGSHGLICDSIAGGIPTISIPNGLERSLNGNAVASLGLGCCFPMERLNARVLAEGICETWNDATKRSAIQNFLNKNRELGEIDANLIIENITL
jgi:rhamnosyltransferase subunit B